MDLKIKKIKVYTDGATEVTNPGAGSYGLVFLYKKGDILHIKEVAVYCPQMVEITNHEDVDLLLRCKKKKPKNIDGKWFMETNNNRMEIGGIVESMSRIKKPEECDLTIVSDSNWAIKSITGEWDAKENLDQVKKAKDLFKKFHSISIKWVKGHTGDRWNEHCDKLATMVIKSKERYRDKPYEHKSEEKIKR